MPAFRAPAQRLTNAFSVMPTTVCYVYTLANLSAQLAANSVQQVGSLFVAPTVAAVTTAFGAASTSTAPAGATLTDMGKSLTIEVNNATDGAAYVKLQEVKYQTATSVFVTGYVVVENNYNGGMANANLLKVAVCRV